MNVLERIYLKSCSSVFFLWDVEELLFLKSAVVALKFSKGRKLVQIRNQNENAFLHSDYLKFV